MLKNGDTVVVALSGGADSVCLLHNLISIKEKYNLTVKACHINHCLRGDESENDMNFCIELCRQNDIEIFTKVVDVHALAEKNGLGCEECGRNVRYEFFDSLAEKYNAKIATAHNADDNLETVIYNLVRGTSLRGLSGIPKIRGNIIRPLIFATRTEIESYCSEFGLVYMTDSTNLTDEFTRNKIRHRVIPCLKEINPSAPKTVLRMNSNLLQIADYLEKSGELLLRLADAGSKGYRADKLAEANTVIIREAVAILLRKSGFSAYSAKNIEEILEIIYSGGKISISGSLIAVNKQGFFRLVKTDSDDFKSGAENEIILTENKQKNQFVYKNKAVNFSNVKISRKFLKSSSKNLINSGIMGKSLELRTRKSGDKIRLSGRGVTKSLKKLMNELKIPEEQRDSLLVLAEGNEVFWIEGIGVSEKAIVTDQEEAVLISVKEK